MTFRSGRRSIGIFALCAVIATAVLAHAYAGKSAARVMWQSMPFIALNNGDFEGTVTVQESMSHGDIGVGAAEDINGEVILVNGAIYSFAAQNGKANRLAATDKLAYVAVGRIETPEATVTLKPGTTMTGTDQNSLFAQLKPYIKNPNSYYAIRLMGGFDAVEARSLPKTVPYRPICQLSIVPYTFTRVTGEMVGYFGPLYAKNFNSLSTEGFHFHFITSAYDKGGHVLKFTTAANVRAVLMRYEQMDVAIPNTATFSQIDLSKYYDATNCPK